MAALFRGGLLITSFRAGTVCLGCPMAIATAIQPMRCIISCPNLSTTVTCSVLCRVWVIFMSP